LLFTVSKWSRCVDNVWLLDVVRADVPVESSLLDEPRQPGVVLVNEGEAGY
jgi:hypothetical protein